MEVKFKHVNKDHEIALILGLIIGVFLVPVENNFYQGLNILYANLALIFGMPLLALAGISLAKFIFGRNKLSWQLIKFVMIGATNTAVNVGVFNYFINITGITKGVPLMIISAVSYMGALVNSYIWNSHWAFKDGFRNTVGQFESFFAVTLLGLLAESGIVIIVSMLIGDLGHPRIAANIANAVGLAFGGIWNFVGYKFFVFKHK